MRVSINKNKLLIVVLLFAGPSTVLAGADPYIGEINYVAFDFAPRNWAKCDGQILEVATYTSLFSLIGNRYGGDGRVTFALPDMRGRTPVHQGRGPGLNNYILGFKGGSEVAALGVGELPSHTHAATATSNSTSTVAPGSSATSTVRVNSGSGDAAPSGNYFAAMVGRSSMYTSSAPDVSLHPGSVTTTLDSIGIETATTTAVSVQDTGIGQPFSIMQPYLTVTCIIALDGLYPPRQ